MTMVKCTDNHRKTHPHRKCVLCQSDCWWGCVGGLFLMCSSVRVDLCVRVCVRTCDACYAMVVQAETISRRGRGRRPPTSLPIDGRGTLLGLNLRQRQRSHQFQPFVLKIFSFLPQKGARTSKEGSPASLGRRRCSRASIRHVCSLNFSWCTYLRWPFPVQANFESGDHTQSKPGQIRR